MKTIRATDVDETSLEVAPPRLKAAGPMAWIFELIAAPIGIKRRVDKTTMLSDWLRKDIGAS
jgi:hypothetical protein